MNISIAKIPVSLHNDLSKSLIEIILDNGSNISRETTKKIIDFWRKDSLTTQVGMETLLNTSLGADRERTIDVLNYYGLDEIVLVN